MSNLVCKTKLGSQLRNSLEDNLCWYNTTLHRTEISNF